MKKILGFTIAFLLAMLVAGGSWAYFSDTESSTGDELLAGTLDLKTDDVDGVSQTLHAENLKRGESEGPGTIQLKNSGTVDGLTLDIAFAYVESDGSPNLVNKTADATAAKIQVITLDYDGMNLLNIVSDANGNGYKDLYDLKNADLTGQIGLGAGATKDFEIEVQLSTSTGNDFQGDGIEMTMTFTLNQQ